MKIACVYGAFVSRWVKRGVEKRIYEIYKRLVERGYEVHWFGFAHASGDYIVKKGSISNKEYTSLNDLSRKMATIDLTQLVTKGLVIRVGEGKRDMRYTLPDYAKITQKITQNGGDSL